MFLRYCNKRKFTVAGAEWLSRHQVSNRHPAEKSFIWLAERTTSCTLYNDYLIPFRDRSFLGNSKDRNNKVVHYENYFDGMNLPKSSANEDLETLSRQKFALLLDTGRFEIRPEDMRDKGVDLQVELKAKGKQLNLRFMVQLKATACVEMNTDGSYSLSLETSNINYLLNSGMPSFYVLFIQERNLFFYQSVQAFVGMLSQKRANWQAQASHTLRFERLLDQQGVDDLYQSTLKRGLFNRKINEKLALKSATVNTGDKLLVDVDLNVTDDREIRKLIETIGLELINETQWKAIIAVHKNASPAVASTAKYNLVLGIAYYYHGEVLTALGFFKEARKCREELLPELREHLDYFEKSTRYALGLMSGETYTAQTAALEHTGSLGHFLRLERLVEQYREDVSEDQDIR